MPLWLTAILPFVVKLAGSAWDRFWENKKTTAVGTVGALTVVGIVEYFARELHCDLSQVNTVAFISGAISFIQGALSTDNGKTVETTKQIITSVVAEQRDKDGKSI